MYEVMDETAQQRPPRLPSKPVAVQAEDECVTMAFVARSARGRWGAEELRGGCACASIGVRTKPDAHLVHNPPSVQRRYEIPGAPTKSYPQWILDVKPANVGVLIWRIENFQVVPWPKDQYGKFFNGDTYIVLNIYRRHGSYGSVIKDLHFWIGSKSSADECVDPGQSLIGDLVSRARAVRCAPP